MKRAIGLLISAIGFSAVAFGQYAITTGGLPSATVNQSYFTSVQTNSGSSATACTIVSGALPPGLTIQPNGVGCIISGIPTVATTASFSMNVSNNQGQTTPNVSLVLPVFGIVSTGLPAGNINSSYLFQFQANGGSSYLWFVLAGSLPPGLALTSSGVLVGTPHANGNYTFTVRVTDQGTGLIDTRSFGITIGTQSGGQFVLVPNALPGAVVNQFYSALITTSGAIGNLNSQNGCLLVQGNLPPGLSLGASGTSCVVSGVPPTQGGFQFQLQATDSAGQITPPVAFSITVTGGGAPSGLSITTAQIPNGSTAVPYAPSGTFTFTATGGTGIYSWFLDSGTLPTGLSLNSDNGALTGTPTLAGSFSFTIRVVSRGLLTSFQQTATKSFVMIVNSGGLTIVESSLPSATVGQSYSSVVHASGGTAPYHWRLNNATVQGFTIDFTSGLISGSTPTAGTYSLPITVSDAGGAQATVAFTLLVSTSFSITTTGLPDGSPGANYNQTLQASGGQTAYNWTIFTGSLPPGLALSLTGSITGTPSVNGLSSFTVLATDAGGRTATKALTIQIGAPGPVQILTVSLPDASVGSQYSQLLTASGGQLPYSWSVVAGALPQGLTLSAAGGLQGTPAQGGSFSFSVQVGDAIGNTTARSLTISVTSTGLVLSPYQLSFNYTIGGVQTVAQQVSVSSSTATGFTATTGAFWLSVSPTTGTTPAVLNIFVNPAGLGAGVYGGSVTVSPSNGTAPQVVAVTLTVSVGPGVTVSPAALTFTAPNGGSIPSTQSLAIGSNSTGLGFFASASGGNWLSVNPQNGTIPATVSVSANPSGLAFGVYSGTITISGSGFAQQIPVTLTVLPPMGSSVTLSKSSLSFSYQVGGALPPSQSVNLGGAFRVSFSASSGDPWLTVTPDVGIIPSSLIISVNPTGLAAATYNSTVVITTTEPSGNHTFTLPVTFTVTSVGIPVITGVVNAASFAGGAVAPGELVAIGGIGLGPASPANLTLDSSGKVATTLGGVQVLFNGFPAPLVYVSASQINAVVPYEIAGQLNLLIAVRFQGSTSVAFPMTLASSAPGVLTLNASGTGPGAILNPDGSANSPLHPAHPGNVVTIYATGEGQTTPPGVTGSVTTVSSTPPLTPRPLLPVTVFIGGQGALVSFFGEAPGIVAGILQLNVQIPASASSGDLTVVFTAGANRSQSGVTVSVQ